MSLFRNWFWEIEETGQGPYYYFYAHFAPSNADHLAAFVRQHPMPGFCHCHFDGKLNYTLCSDPNYEGSYDIYVDKSNHAAMVTGLASDKPRTSVVHVVWDLIEICGHHLHIECSPGNRVDPRAEAETHLLLTLAQSSEITLTQWGVNSGGDGYASCIVRSGDTAAELLEYLQVEALRKPDFAQIEAEVHLALGQLRMADRYQVGACSIEGWRICIVVLHDVEKTTGTGAAGWDMGPHTSALYKVVSLVSKRCKVPGLVGGAVHDPHNFHQLIGSALTFGYPHRGTQEQNSLHKE